MTDWQPIATAPKDGTRILAWAGDTAIIIRVHEYWRRWTDDSGDDLPTEPTYWIAIPLPPGKVEP